MYKIKSEVLKKVVRSACVLAGFMGLNSGINASTAAQPGMHPVYSKTHELQIQDERLTTCFNSMAASENMIATLCTNDISSSGRYQQLLVKVFQKNSSPSFENVIEIALPEIELMAPANESNFTIKTDGKWLVVAVAEEVDMVTQNTGAVYIYEYDAGINSYNLVEKIISQPSDPYMRTEGFGIAVDIDQNQLLIKSAYENEHNGGFGYIYRYLSDGDTWYLINKVDIGMQSSGRYFKQNLIIDGNTFYVSDTGMNSAYNGFGEVDIYEYDEYMQGWMYKDSVSTVFGSEYGFFGQSFTVKDNTLVAMASNTEFRNTMEAPLKSKLIVFSKQVGHGHWERQQDILPPNHYEYDNGFFGIATKFIGDELMVGAPGANDARGVVYRYDNNLNFIEELQPLEFEYGANYGASIESMGEGVFVVGAPGATLLDHGPYTEAAYVFEADAGEDLIAPEITLIGGEVINVKVGETFNDPGVIAIDNVDGDISTQVIVDGYVDINVPGEYVLIYNVSDSSGNYADEKIRTIIVHESNAPVIDDYWYLVDGNNLTVNVIVGDLDGDLQGVELISLLDNSATTCQHVIGAEYQCEIIGHDLGTYGFIISAFDAAENVVYTEPFEVELVDNGSECYTALNQDHVDAGRAYIRWGSIIYAVGSDTYLGSRYLTQTSSLEQVSEGVWNKVNSCE